MKRDRFLTLLKEAMTDRNSPICKHSKEIWDEAMFLFKIITMAQPEDLSVKLNKLAYLRFIKNATDEEIINELKINKEELDKLIKLLEETTADVLLSVLADYVEEFREVQVSIFMEMAHKEAIEHINRLNEQEEEFKIRQLMEVLEKYRKKYTIDGTNMGRSKKPKDNMTLFDYWQN